jgi:uncharacterized tellurite resistance protein B-like protein
LIAKLSAFFKRLAGETDNVDRDEHGVRVAVAALLIEMARADFVDDESERRLVTRLLKSHFALEKHEAERLVGVADARADEVVSLQEFTREIHETLTGTEKLRIMEMLFRVALADGRLDKHERHLLSKVAGLLYIPRAEYDTLKDAILREHGQ